MTANTKEGLDLKGQFRLLAMFFASPSRALETLSRKAPLAASFVLLTSLGLFLQWALVPFVEAAAMYSLEDTLGAFQMEQSLRMMRKIQLLSLLFYPLTLTAKWLLLGAVLALICQLLGGPATFRQALSISLHASFLPLLQNLLVLLILLLTGIESVRHPSDLRPAIGLDLLWTSGNPWRAALLNALNPIEAAYLVFLLAAVRRANPGFSNLRTLAATLPFWLMTLAVRIFLGGAGQAGLRGTDD